MAFFGLFKKKESFDDLLSQPLTDPLIGSSTPSFNNDLATLPDQNMGMPSEYNQQTSAYPDFSQQLNQQNPFDQPQNTGFSQQSTQSFQQPPNQGFNGFDNNQPNSFNQRSFGQPQGFQQQPAGYPVNPNQNRYEQPQTPKDREHELIMSKLDNIRILLETLNQRVDNLEKAIEQPEEKTTRPRRNNWY